MDRMGTAIRVWTIPRWVYAAIALQIALPLGALILEDRPSRFGYQMFASDYEISYEAFDTRGDRIELGELLATTTRPELPWVDYLPAFLCDSVDNAATVVVRQPGKVRTLTCD